MAENTIKFKIESDDKALEGTRKKIEEIKSAMLKAEDAETFNKLALEAGGLETEIRRVEDAVTSLAGSGSELTKMSNSFSRVGSSLASMDFGAAAEEAGRLASISKTMNFGSAISSLKSLGSTFASLGKALLTNPFFLLVGIITAIVVGVVKLMDELGILTAIFDAVGAAIGYVIGLLKDLLDWLGLTSYAEDEEAERQKARAEAVQAARTAAFNQLVAEKEISIAKMKAEGASVEDIEDAEIDLAKTRYESLRLALEQQEVFKTAQIESYKAFGFLQKATELQIELDEQRNAVKRSEIALIETTSRVEKARDDRGKARHENYKKRKEEEKKIQEEIANAQLKADEMIKLANIENIEDEIERQRQLAVFKENKAFAEIDLKKLTDEQIEALTAQHNMRLEQIEADSLDKRQAKRDEIKAKEAESEANLMTEITALEDAFLQNQISVQDQERNAVYDKYNAIIEAARAKGKDVTLLEEAQNSEIEAINIKYEQAKAERERVMEENKLSLATSVLSAIGSHAKEGSAIQKAIAVAQTTIDTYQGAQAAFTATAKSPIAVAFPAAPYLAAASAVVSGLANVRRILSVDETGSTTPSVSGGTTANAPNLGTRQQADTTPSMNLNNGVEQNAGGSVDRQVMVVDYTDIQNKRNEIEGLQERVSLF